MKLAYSTIIHGDLFAYSGRISTVIRVTGGPFKVPYLPAVDSRDPGFAEETEFFLDLALEQSKEDGETSAVVLTGIEPLWQGNTIFELTKKLREVGFFVKVETSGFYPTDLRSVAGVANFISLDYKHILASNNYLPLIGEKTNFDVFQSNLLKSLVFMEHGKAFKEVKTVIIPGINDSVEVVENIAKTIRNSCDQYTLQQFVPWPTPLLDPRFELIVPPTRLQLLELAQFARQHVGKVVVKCHESEEQEVIPRTTKQK